jgi:hypothetical protein
MSSLQIQYKSELPATFSSAIAHPESWAYKVAFQQFEFSLYQ